MGIKYYNLFCPETKEKLRVGEGWALDNYTLYIGSPDLYNLKVFLKMHKGKSIHFLSDEEIAEKFGNSAKIE